MPAKEVRVPFGAEYVARGGARDQSEKETRHGEK